MKPDLNNYVLSIDLGSGGPKTAIVSDKGEIISCAFEKVEIKFLPGGGAEQDPNEWWTSVIRCARKSVSESKVPPERIVAIGCDSQYSVIVPVDGNIQPLMNAVHWMDTRGSSYNLDLIKGFPSLQGYGLFKLIKWIRLTGIAPTKSGIDSLGHILFIKNERPEIYNRTCKFLEPSDFITSKLTGNFSASQHSMILSMLVDNRKWNSLEYNSSLLKLAGLDKEKFPQLISNGSIAGQLLPGIANKIGLKPGIPVIGGINDTNASVMGCGAFNFYEGIIYIGTSLVMSCHVPFKKVDIFHMICSMPGPLEGMYLMVAEQGIGGRVMEFYLKNMIYGDDNFCTGEIKVDAFERAERVAADIPAGSGGLIFLPWLTGSLAPEENAFARGCIFNLSIEASRGHVVRALMESIAFNNRWSMEAVDKFTGRRSKSFRFAGGGAKSDLWAQIHADVLGVPIHQVFEPTFATIKGTAFLAFKRLGIITLDKMRDLVKIKRVYYPDINNSEVYDNAYKNFRYAYKSNKKLFRRMNQVI